MVLSGGLSGLTVDCKPLVLVLALGQLHHLPQAATAQCNLSILPKLIACCAAFADSLAESVRHLVRC